MTTPYLLQPDPNGTCCDCSQRTSPCDECECCMVTISYETSSSGDKGKCGQTAYDAVSGTPAAYYLTQVETQDYSQSHTESNTVNNTSCHWNETITTQYTWYYNDPFCAITTNCTGSGTSTYHGGSISFDPCTGGGCNSLGDCLDSSDYPITNTTATTKSGSADCTYNGGSSGTNTSSTSGTFTLSNEYTTEQMVSDLLANMPPYAVEGDQYGQSAQYTMSNVTELSVYIRKLQYTVKPSTGCGASWDEVFTPEDGSASSSTAKSCGSPQSFEIIPAAGNANGTWEIQNLKTT